MKILQILVLLFLFVGFYSISKAQICGPSNTIIFIKDGSGNVVKGAKIEFTELPKKFEEYQNSSLVFKNDSYFIYFDEKPTGEQKIKISAKGFESTVQKIDIREAHTNGYEVILRLENSKEKAIFSPLTELQGRVSDENGAIILNVIVKITDKNGFQKEIKTNENGYYYVWLKKGLYSIQFNHDYFEKLIINDWLISFGSQMNLDAVLIGKNLEPCGVSGADCLGNNGIVEVNGKIEDSTGNPIPNVRITAFQKDKNAKETKSKLDGTYKFYLAEGNYDIEYYADGFIRNKFINVEVYGNKLKLNTTLYADQKTESPLPESKGKNKSSNNKKRNK